MKPSDNNLNNIRNQIVHHDLEFGSVLRSLDRVSRQVKEKGFDKDEHDRKARLGITRLFLMGYFILIAGAFIFCYIYNNWASGANIFLLEKIGPTTTNLIPYLDISNTVSIITTTLSSGVGFVIGYYFKNKGE